MLDTDHLSFLQNPASPMRTRIRTRMRAVGRENVGGAVASLQEQFVGCQTKIVQARTTAGVVVGYELLYRVFKTARRVRPVPFTPLAGAIYDGLVASKVKVGRMDLRIAATALAHNLVLVTRNYRDFVQVPNLKLEDWTK